ncbi:hypothetical protein ACPEIC_00900 [Stenotrophomonas sp. NPDC087984]
MGDLLTIGGLPATGDRPTAIGLDACGPLTTGDRPLVILFQNPGPEVSHFETPATYTVAWL